MASAVSCTTRKRFHVNVPRMRPSISVRNVNPDLVERLDAFARENELTRAAAAKFLLSKALTNEGFGVAGTARSAERRA